MQEFDRRCHILSCSHQRLAHHGLVHKTQPRKLRHLIGEVGITELALEVLQMPRSVNIENSESFTSMNDETTESMTESHKHFYKAFERIL